MTKLWWRIKFVFAYKKIFSKPANTFNAKWKSGWELGEKLYEEHKNEKPWDAAINEITEWYCD
jgi:hypothetical protein